MKTQAAARVNDVPGTRTCHACGAQPLARYEWCPSCAYESNHNAASLLCAPFEVDISIEDGRFTVSIPASEAGDDAWQCQGDVLTDVIEQASAEIARRCDEV